MGNAVMQRRLAASALFALGLALPAQAGSPPPRHDINVHNSTGYALTVEFYNGTEKLGTFSTPVMRVVAPKNGSASGNCNTNGSCSLQYCINLNADTSIGGITTGGTFCNAVADTGGQIKGRGWFTATCLNFSYQNHELVAGAC